MNESVSRGMSPPAIQDLPQLKDRLTFLYLERCRISCESSALKAEDKDGFVLIPSHALLVLLLGPGTSITHRAVELLGESGMTIIWTGEMGARFYGYGKSLSEGTELLLKQAQIVSTPRLHIEAVKRMYGLRYPDEDLTNQTLRQLRGKEGTRMKREYARLAEQYGIEWSGRSYNPEDFKSGDPVNRALSVANVTLYGLCHAVICGLGLSPGLGFIHTGHQLSFVYDIADLYKAEITLPIAFSLAAESTDKIESRVRMQVKLAFKNQKLIKRAIADILYILDEQSESESTLELWDGMRGSTEAGTLYTSRDSTGES